MELLILTTDLGDYDADDVIDVKPDGFEWGREERNNPIFTVVRVPDADPEKYLTGSLFRKVSDGSLVTSAEAVRFQPEELELYKTRIWGYSPDEEVFHEKVPAGQIYINKVEAKVEDPAVIAEAAAVDVDLTKKP